MPENDTLPTPTETGQERALEHVGRYQIRALLGEGSMAAVYEAYDPRIDRTIAIKLLHPSLCEQEDYRTRFVREAKGAGLLSHPNIVTVHDVGEDAGRPYIAMELVEGSSLADLLREKRPLDTKRAVDIGIQLAKALDYAHKKGIVHRDVKPGNIMLVRDTNVAKVGDFGICRIDSGDATHKTRVGDILGTPHYMSPEQVLGQPVDGRSDLFSAGVVLYQLLTGVLPFEGDTLVTVALKIAKSEPEPIDKLRPDLPLSLRRIVDRAIKKQPDKRFQTGDELAKALIGVAKEIAEAEAAEGKRRRVPLRVRWALLMATAVAITMLVAGSLISEKLRNALQDQVIDYGGSLARFMAAQSAVPVLSEDWAALEALVADTVSGQNFSYLQVVDHKNVVRGSSVASQVDAEYKAPTGVPVRDADGRVAVQRHALPDGQNVLEFSAPVLFQGKHVGRVYLGILEAPLARVSRLTWLMLGLLTLVTSAAVAVFSYFLAMRLSQPLRVMRNSLGELAQGHYDYRIAEARRDELGELYAAFDTTAAALQQRHETHGSAASAPKAPHRSDAA